MGMPIEEQAAAATGVTIDGGEPDGHLDAEPGSDLFVAEVHGPPNGAAPRSVISSNEKPRRLYPIEELLRAQSRFIKAQIGYIHNHDTAQLAMEQEAFILAQAGVLEVFGGFRNG